MNMSLLLIVLASIALVAVTQPLTILDSEVLLDSKALTARVTDGYELCMRLQPEYAAFQADTALYVDVYGSASEKCLSEDQELVVGLYRRMDQQISLEKLTEPFIKVVFRNPAHDGKTEPFDIAFHFLAFKEGSTHPIYPVVSPFVDANTRTVTPYHSLIVRSCIYANGENYIDVELEADSNYSAVAAPLYVSSIILPGPNVLPKDPKALDGLYIRDDRRGTITVRIPLSELPEPRLGHFYLYAPGAVSITILSPLRSPTRSLVLTDFIYGFSEFYAEAQHEFCPIVFGLPPTENPLYENLVVLANGIIVPVNDNETDTLGPQAGTVNAVGLAQRPRTILFYPHNTQSTDEWSLNVAIVDNADLVDGKAVLHDEKSSFPLPERNISSVINVRGLPNGDIVCQHVSFNGPPVTVSLVTENIPNTQMFTAGFEYTTDGKMVSQFCVLSQEDVDSELLAVVVDTDPMQKDVTITSYSPQLGTQYIKGVYHHGIALPLADFWNHGLSENNLGLTIPTDRLIPLRVILTRDGNPYTGAVPELSVVVNCSRKDSCSHSVGAQIEGTTTIVFIPSEIVNIYTNIQTWQEMLSVVVMDLKIAFERGVTGLEIDIVPFDRTDMPVNIEELNDLHSRVIQNAKFHAPLAFAPESVFSVDSNGQTIVTVRIDEDSNAHNKSIAVTTDRDVNEDVLSHIAIPAPLDGKPSIWKVDLGIDGCVYYHEMKNLSGSGARQVAKLCVPETTAIEFDYLTFCHKTTLKVTGNTQRYSVSYAFPTDDQMVPLENMKEMTIADSNTMTDTIAAPAFGESIRLVLAIKDRITGTVAVRERTLNIFEFPIAQVGKATPDNRHVLVEQNDGTPAYGAIAAYDTASDLRDEDYIGSAVTEGSSFVISGLPMRGAESFPRDREVGMVVSVNKHNYWLVKTLPSGAFSDDNPLEESMFSFYYQNPAYSTLVKVSVDHDAVARVPSAYMSLISDPVECVNRTGGGALPTELELDWSVGNVLCVAGEYGTFTMTAPDPSEQTSEILVFDYEMFARYNSTFVSPTSVVEGGIVPVNTDCIFTPLDAPYEQKMNTYGADKRVCYKIHIPEKRVTTVFWNYGSVNQFTVNDYSGFVTGESHEEAVVRTTKEVYDPEGKALRVSIGACYYGMSTQLLSSVSETKSIFGVPGAIPGKRFSVCLVYNDTQFWTLTGPDVVVGPEHSPDLVSQVFNKNSQVIRTEFFNDNISCRNGICTWSMTKNGVCPPEGTNMIPDSLNWIFETPWNPQTEDPTVWEYCIHASDSIVSMTSAAPHETTMTGETIDKVLTIIYPRPENAIATLAIAPETGCAALGDAEEAYPIRGKIQDNDLVFNNLTTPNATYCIRVYSNEGSYTVTTLDSFKPVFVDAGLGKQAYYWRTRNEVAIPITDGIMPLGASWGSPENTCDPNTPIDTDLTFSLEFQHLIIKSDRGLPQWNEPLQSKLCIHLAPSVVESIFVVADKFDGVFWAYMVYYRSIVAHEGIISGTFGSSNVACSTCVSYITNEKECEDSTPPVDAQPLGLMPYEFKFTDEDQKCDEKKVICIKDSHGNSQELQLMYPNCAAVRSGWMANNPYSCFFYEEIANRQIEGSFVMQLPDAGIDITYEGHAQRSGATSTGTFTAVEDNLSVYFSRSIIPCEKGYAAVVGAPEECGPTTAFPPASNVFFEGQTGVAMVNIQGLSSMITICIFDGINNITYVTGTRHMDINGADNTIHSDEVTMSYLNGKTIVNIPTSISMPDGVEIQMGTATAPLSNGVAVLKTEASESTITVFTPTWQFPISVSPRAKTPVLIQVMSQFIRVTARVALDKAAVFFATDSECKKTLPQGLNEMSVEDGIGLFTISSSGLSSICAVQIDNDGTRTVLFTREVDSLPPESVVVTSGKDAIIIQASPSVLGTHIALVSAAVECTPSMFSGMTNVIGTPDGALVAGIVAEDITEDSILCGKRSDSEVVLIPITFKREGFLEDNSVLGTTTAVLSSTVALVALASLVIMCLCAIRSRKPQETIDNIVEHKDTTADTPQSEIAEMEACMTGTEMH